MTFKKFIINNDNDDTDLFTQLSKSANFENICKGRRGAILVDPLNDTIPIVRTTTIYKNPPSKFLQIHHQIINQIPNITFNNAMIEIYTPKYRRMGFHTDQSLDLQPNSHICLFSCYENNSNAQNNIRKLKVQNKITKKYSEIQLNNNSIVIFSTQTNQENVHKIVLESHKSTTRWLGITFRLSKTYIKFINKIPHFVTTNILLTSATDTGKYM